MVENFDQELSIKGCIEKCLKISHNHVKLATGAKEIIKCLVREQKVELVVVADDLNEECKNILIALCNEKGVFVVNLEDRKELAKIAPFKAKKVGAVGIKDFVLDSREKSYIMTAIGSE